ncbi:hypothetical protein GF362_01715 [Candidatus Dojkabacteria bacterium]|nr:hypothetical protein [Candidatus Dojkabacteria bacterium]
MVKKLSKEIETYLTEFGLSPEEITIYVALLQLGRSSVLDISRKTKIKRSTAHNYVEKLIAKGIVSQTSQGSRRMMVAEVPEKLKSILDHKRWEIKRLENKLPEVVKTLHSMIPKVEENTKVEVKYYEGKEHVESAYKQVLKAEKVYGFYNNSHIESAFPGNEPLFYKALDENPDMEIWEVVEDPRPNRKELNQTHERYYCRFLPDGFSFAYFDLVFSDKHICMVNVREQNPTIVLIYSVTMAGGMKALFDIAWEFSLEG